MSIKEWPAQERPRERLLSLGAEALSDAELLTIFLRTGTQGKTALDLARDALLKFGSLREVLSAKQNDFCDIDGFGPAKFAQLQATIEMSKRCFFEQIKEERLIDSSDACKDFVLRALKHQSHEVFACLFLDTQHKVIHFEELFQGTLNAAYVHPREVVRKVIEYNASAIVLAHNHPSGCTSPSKSDHRITQQIQSAVKLIDVRVLDHLIVGNNKVYSFAEHGEI